MGGRHSKRSVDISGGGRESDEAQPLDGRMEKLDEGPKMVVNGASHSEPKADQHDEPVSNGDPVPIPEQVVQEEAGPSSPSEEVQPEPTVTEVIQPPKKKEKVKKKWSLRSLSFSKKDKSKPGKEETAKEDAEDLPEASEEKTEEGGVSFLSSVAETMSGATEAVTDAVQAAEHKVEEGLTATQDQVEKISAKVAEKAEALVEKMEAMTVQAVDAAQEMLGVGHGAATGVATAEVAVPDAGVVSANLPEVQVLPDSSVIVSILPEVAEVAKAVSEQAEVKLVEPMATSVTVPDSVVTPDSMLPESVTTIFVTGQTPEDIISMVRAGWPDLVYEKSTCEITGNVVNESDIPAVTEVEVCAQGSSVTKTEEMPPPLPASPPPSTLIVEVVTEVINSTVALDEAEGFEAAGSETLPGVSRPLSPNTARVPVALLEAAPTSDLGAGGDEHRHPSSTTVVAEVITQVIETAERTLAATVFQRQQQENLLHEQVAPEEQEITQGSSESASGTNDTTENESEPPPPPPPGKSAEE